MTKTMIRAIATLYAVGMLLMLFICVQLFLLNRTLDDTIFKIHEMERTQQANMGFLHNIDLNIANLTTNSVIINDSLMRIEQKLPSDFTLDSVVINDSLMRIEQELRRSRRP